MLSAAMYTRLPDAPAIQPFFRAAPEVVGVGGARAEIRGYVDVPVEVAGVAVRQPLLVVEGLGFPLIIGMDILRAHRAVLTLDESAPVRLRVRVCAVCGEQRTASPAEPSSSKRATPLPTVLRGALPLLPQAPPLPPAPTHPPAALSHQPLKNRPRRHYRRNARASAAQPFVQVAESSQESRASLLVDVRVSAPPSPIANASAPILVCPRVSVTPSPIARARAAELRPLTPAPRSTQATRAPLLVPVRVSLPPSTLTRAPTTEPRPQVPAIRAAPSPPVLRAGPPVAPETRAAPPTPAVQAPQPLVPVAHSTQAP